MKEIYIENFSCGLQYPVSDLNNFLLKDFINRNHEYNCWSLNTDADKVTAKNKWSDTEKCVWKRKHNRVVKGAVLGNRV